MRITDQLQQAEAIVRAAREHLRQSVDEALQKPVPGTRQLMTDPNCIMISLSSIRASRDLCLAPEAYDVTEQRRAILRMIDSAEPAYALQIIKELCDTGRTTSKYLRDVRLHPDVIRRLNDGMSAVA